MPEVPDGEAEGRHSRGRMPPLGGRRGGCPGCSPRERGPRAPLYRDGAAERDGEPIEGSTMVARPRNRRLRAVIRGALAKVMINSSLEQKKALKVAAACKAARQ